ncbi:MAG: hypothetical protein ACRDIC_22690 [bacterium]
MRLEGPAPPRWKVVLAAVALTLLIGGLELAVEFIPGYRAYGLMTLTVGGIGSLVFVIAGVLLTAAGALRAGAWAGGLGITLVGTVLVFWIATGGRWFP